VEFGWRSAFIVPGVVSVALGLLAMRFMGRDVDVAKDEAKSKPAFEVSSNVLLRVFLFVGVAALFGGLIFNGITVALPKLFEQQLHIADGDLLASGAFVAFAFAFAAFAQLPTGRFLDRYGAKPVVLVILTLQVPILILVGQFFGVPLLAISIIALLLVFGEIPVSDWLIGRHVSSAWQSRIFAVNYLFSLGVSALAVPLISYLHNDTGDFQKLFWILGLSAALVLAVGILLPGRRPAAAAQPSE
jgi:MFS family permease